MLRLILIHQGGNLHLHSYGTVEGEVIGVSNDVIDDEKRGPVYSSRIRLKEDHLNIKGERVGGNRGQTTIIENML